MITLKACAHAKLNLTLDVVGVRPDGYHDLEMVMQEITLGDAVTLHLETGEPWRCVSDSGEIPCDNSNLAIKAANLFFETSGIDPQGLTVEIQKNTPVCAGMGGGSADGAAVLKLLYEHYKKPISQEKLYQIAEKVGSDVPFALFGGTALAREKGQVLRAVSPMPRCRILICKPPFPISTPQLFRVIDSCEISRRPDTENMLEALSAGDIGKVAQQLYNVFEPVVSAEHPEIHDIKEEMLSCGALGVCMTGSGPTVFGIFSDGERAESCYKRLRSHFSDTYLTEPV